MDHRSSLSRRLSDAEQAFISKQTRKAAHAERVHHSLLFWFGVVLFLAAISIYILSGDLSWRPQIH
jgi:hypothetical protein